MRILPVVAAGEGFGSLDWGDGHDLVDAFAAYAAARREFLRVIGCRPTSMREPLAEFAEILVARLTGGRLAANPVQKGWDLIADDGTTTQVKYLANASGTWVNGHTVAFTEGVDRFALVVFEALSPLMVLVFPRATLAEVCRRLGKRHPNQESTLQLTERNIRTLWQQRAEFASLGVIVMPTDPPESEVPLPPAPSVPRR